MFCFWWISSACITSDTGLSFCLGDEGFCTGYLQGRPASHRTPGLYHIGHRTFLVFPRAPLPGLWAAVGLSRSLHCSVQLQRSFYGATSVIPLGEESRCFLLTAGHRFLIFPRSFFSFFILLSVLLAPLWRTLSGTASILLQRNGDHTASLPSSVAYVHCHLYRPSGDSLALLY